MTRPQPPQPSPAGALAAAPAAFPHAGLLAALRLALGGPCARGARVGVAVSGGADSAMLAAHAAAAARELGLALTIFHVHHGLQSAADEWERRVRELGALLEAPVAVERVLVRPDGKGEEAAAREARYQALGRLARGHGVCAVLLAHHRGDQAETVLLRLLRGTGVAGMAAMAPASEGDGVRYLRPWLDQDRAAILDAAAAFEAATGWRPVQDPTNADPRYTRAAVRELLAPVLDARWPGWRAIVARHAGHMAEAAQILEEVARGDFAGLDPAPDGRSFSLAAWRRLSAPRQAQVLRYWFGLCGARMPTDARMRDLLRQLRGLHSLGHDRQLRVEQAGHAVRCHRGRVWMEPRPSRAVRPTDEK